MMKLMFAVISLVMVQTAYSMECLRMLCVFKPRTIATVEIGNSVETFDGFLWKVERNGDRYTFVATVELADRKRAIRLGSSPVGYYDQVNGSVVIVGKNQAVYSYNKLARKNEWQV